MNRVFLWPAALLALAAVVAPAPAQYVPPGVPAAPPSDDNFVKVKVVAPAPAADMQEDVEILRRLLDGAFAQAYGFNGLPKGSPPIIFSTTASDAFLQPYPGWTAPGSNHPAPHVEGVYLKDYGVVYTTTLPLPPFSVLPTTGGAPGTQTPPDDWDRIRKELRGETPTPESKPVPGHTPLSQVILKVLADNGKHFGSLADGERISVAVTFRGAANCANCHQNPWNKGQPGAPVFGNQWQDWPTYPNPPASAYGAAPMGGKPAAAAAGLSAEPQPAATPAWLTDARNSILLGDLHMKQGKAQEAIAAYQIALGKIGNGSSPSSSKEDQVAELLAGVDVCNKLADAYVRLGNSDSQASAMLKKAAELAKRAEELTGGAVTANPAAGAPTVSPLPAKLVVTATKKQLDDMAAGRMTFEMFCKAATVDYVDPSKK